MRGLRTISAGEVDSSLLNVRVPFFLGTEGKEFIHNASVGADCRSVTDPKTWQDPGERQPPRLFVFCHPWMDEQAADLSESFGKFQHVLIRDCLVSTGPDLKTQTGEKDSEILTLRRPGRRMPRPRHSSNKQKAYVKSSTNNSTASGTSRDIGPGCSCAEGAI